VPVGISCLSAVEAVLPVLICSEKGNAKYRSVYCVFRTEIIEYRNDSDNDSKSLVIE